VSIEVTAPALKFRLTPRIVAAVAHEEGLVLEAYKDSLGVWTWALGVAETGGHNVRQYKDNPSTVEAAVAASIDIMRTKYLPAVQRAFEGFRLKEHEIAGALSFHWNTGAILRATWVKSWRAGDMDAAMRGYLAYNKPASIIERRKRDADLFFDAKWPDLRVPLLPVRKPSYTPSFRNSRLVDILPIAEQIMGGS
jgi:lysozyme